MGQDRPGPLRTWLCEHAHGREAPSPTHPRSSCPDPFLTPLTTGTVPWPTVWSRRGQRQTWPAQPLGDRESHRESRCDTKRDRGGVGWGGQVPRPTRGSSTSLTPSADTDCHPGTHSTPTPHAREPLPLPPTPLHSAPWPPAVPTRFPHKATGRGPGLCGFAATREALSSYCVNVAQALPPTPRTGAVSESGVQGTGPTTRTRVLSKRVNAAPSPPRDTKQHRPRASAWQHGHVTGSRQDPHIT